MNCIVDFIVNFINHNDVYNKIYSIMTDGHDIDRNVIMFMSHDDLNIQGYCTSLYYCYQTK